MVGEKPKAAYCRLPDIGVRVHEQRNQDWHGLPRSGSSQPAGSRDFLFCLCAENKSGKPLHRCRASKSARRLGGRILNLLASRFHQLEQRRKVSRVLHGAEVLDSLNAKRRVITSNSDLRQRGPSLDNLANRMTLLGPNQL